MVETIIEGYFTEKECLKIKEKMQDKTFLHFDISYSNYAGNCKLIVRSQNTNHSKSELKKMFIYCCISELAKQ